MDNPSRSERSRKIAIQAALAIIARDGPGHLTFDAMARESGISKGGLMHQFPNKGAVLKALLEHEMEYFAKFSGDYLAATGDTLPEPSLSAQIAVLREVMSNPHPAAFAIIAALVEDPGLLSISRDAAEKTVQQIKAESDDPDLSLLRWQAAQGLALTVLFGMSPLSGKERERLFERLLDDRQWPAAGKRPARKTRSTRGDQRR